MVFFNIKKLEDHIKNKSITTREFIAYSFFVIGIGTITSIIGSTIYLVNRDTQNILNILKLIPVIIIIIKYNICYKIIKDKDIYLFLYTIMPLTFVLRFRYFIFLSLPLIILNMVIIRYFDLDANFWMLINSQIMNIILNLFLAIHFIKILKRIYNNGE